MLKLDGLTHEKLKENIEKVIKDIPKEKYENIFNPLTFSVFFTNFIFFD
jgi:hypothetical protein